MQSVFIEAGWLKQAILAACELALTLVCCALIEPHPRTRRLFLLARTTLPVQVDPDLRCDYQNFLLTYITGWRHADCANVNRWLSHFDRGRVDHDLLNPFGRDIPSGFVGTSFDPARLALLHWEGNDANDSGWVGPQGAPSLSLNGTVGSDAESKSLCDTFSNWLKVEADRRLLDYSEAEIQGRYPQSINGGRS